MRTRLERPMKVVFLFTKSCEQNIFDGANLFTSHSMPSATITEASGISLFSRVHCRSYRLLVEIGARVLCDPRSRFVGHLPMKRLRYKIRLRPGRLRMCLFQPSVHR